MRDDQKNIDEAFSDQTEFVSLDGKENLPKDELVDEVRPPMGPRARARVGQRKKGRV